MVDKKEVSRLYALWKILKPILGGEQLRVNATGISGDIHGRGCHFSDLLRSIVLDLHHPLVCDQASIHGPFLVTQVAKADRITYEESHTCLQ